MNTDQKEIDQLTNCFFDLFTNAYGRTPQLDTIYDLCIPEGLIINNTEGNTQIYSLESFITPRKIILTDGSLSDFREWEESSLTDIYRNIAHRVSHYAKSGKRQGKRFEAKGVKFIQFIKQQGVWKISSVTWDDE